MKSDKKEKSQPLSEKYMEEHGHPHENEEEGQECHCEYHHHEHGEDGCGCGHEHKHHHEHGDGCGCGHEHGHQHEHEDGCGCGHEHEHHHEHGDSCGCGEPQTKGTCVMPDEKMEKRVYLLEGLDCANCAAKVEAKIRQMPEVGYASVAYATRQLRVSAPDYTGLMEKMQAVIDSVEDGITVVPREEVKKEAEKEEKKSAIPEKYKPLVTIGTGAALFLIGFAAIYIGGLEETDRRLFPLFIAAYLVLGGKVLMTAGRNMKKGQVFDENFLMCIATLGAFAIREFPEAVGVMLFYRIGAYFEDRATEQSRSQIMDAVDLRPEVVNLVVGDEVRVIDAEEAVVGDIVLVRPGDRVPLDGVVVDGETRLDTSAITGEPVPVKAGAGDLVSSGCVNTSGQIKIRVEKVLKESMVTRILDSVENAAASKPNIDKFITRFARVYTPFVVIFAILVAVALPFVMPNWHFFVDENYAGTVGVVYGTSGTASVLTALTFLVISCPCALVLSVPLAFFSGIGAASRKNILFKGGVAIEALKGVKAVVMDKTGTITKGNFVVQNAVCADEGMTPEELLAISASCELSSTHPIGNSIVEAAKGKNLAIERPSRVEEIAGHGVRASIRRGVVLCGNRKLMEANGVDLSGYKKEQFGTEALTALNGRFAGHIVISDTMKPDAVTAIARTKRYGVVTAMLTGDTQDSAEAVAKEAGIDEVHAKLLPEDKLKELQKIREKYGSVMFVGDGINDAPVLAGADVGAAMGSGADAAIEAADVVFMTSEMGAIPQAIDIARATSRISWQNVYFALAVKAIVLIAGLFGFANMWVAVFADTGVSVLCLLNSIRILYRK